MINHFPFFDRLSVTIPTVSTNALGYGAFLGLYANLRYQLLCGVDRAMISHFDVIGVSLFFSTALSILNAQLGETSRLAWLEVGVTTCKRKGVARTKAISSKCYTNFAGTGLTNST